MNRDFDANPYSADEARVAKFLFDKGVGGGDDPIGSLLASHEYLVADRNEWQKQAREAKRETVGWQRRAIGKDGNPWTIWYTISVPRRDGDTDWDGLYSYEFRPLTVEGTE
jgi:hypothetical protein